MKGKYQPSKYPYNCYENLESEFQGFKQWEIVYDGEYENGLPEIGMIIQIYPGEHSHPKFRLNSNGNRELEEISKCPDDIAAKALPFIERGLLCYATPDGNVIGRNEAMQYKK